MQALLASLKDSTYKLQHYFTPTGLRVKEFIYPHAIVRFTEGQPTQLLRRFHATC